ncbi:MAG: glucose-6-phosphate isomerase [Planctomycetaceae bacterium]
MSDLIRYDAQAAHKLLKHSHWEGIEQEITSAGRELFDDVELLRSGGEIPPHKQPLDAGFIELPRQLLDEYAERRDNSLIGRIQNVAQEWRTKLDRVVLLGIGGSYMGARALFESLLHPYHNQLSRKRRANVPRISFEGNNLDNDTLRGLLELLETSCANPEEIEQRWGIVVISKSGGTLETAVGFRLFRQALEAYYGPETSRGYVIPITGESGKLRDVSNHQKYTQTFPIPDGVGGRFSVFTAVGLLPAALMGLDIVQLLEGAAHITERTRTDPFGQNAVLDFVATSQLMEQELGCHIRVLSTWGSRLEAVGLWYDQLLAESLGKDERGATPITVVNTRDLHSRGQQHQEGRRDKFITNVIVETPSTEPLTLPETADDLDQLNRHAGKTIPTFLRAAIDGTNRAYADAKRPTADITLPRLNEFAIGQLLQMLMLATVVEGRAMGVNPYGQPGVEAYKQNMNAILNQ